MSAPPYPTPRNLLAGRTALITAAAGTGIGFATALRFAEEGATLMISDIHPRRLAESAERINEKTGQLPATQLCDVSQEDQVQSLREAAARSIGTPDILVNNAGLGGSATVTEMTDDQWFRVLDVTLTSVMRMSRAFLPGMYARGSGAVINNASVLGWRAQAQQSHYAAAKAGVMAFTRCTAIEAAPHNVRVNAVAPSIAMHAFLNRAHIHRIADGTHLPRSLRPRRRALGSGQRHPVPGQRSFHLHDRRNRLRLQPESVTMPAVFASPLELLSRVGETLGTSDWLLVDQARIDAFADATGDHQWIHTNPQAGRPPARSAPRLRTAISPCRWSMSFCRKLPKCAGCPWV